MKARTAVLVVVVVLLLAPALLLTLLRLTDPTQARLIQAVTFTPVAAFLYAAVLALLLSMMAVRRTHAVLYSVTAGLALVGLVLHAVWFAPQLVGDVPEPAPDAEPVVVMTSNLLRGAADGTDLMAQVREVDVDLLVVNEITISSLAELEQAGLREVLPFREGNPAADGVGSGTMVFSTRPTVLRDVLDTQLGALVVDTGELRLIAVHPLSPVWPDGWRDDHDQVLAAVKEYTPDLVAGDFNATPDHRPMRALDEAGYRDSVDVVNGGFQPTWPVNGLFGLLGFLGPVAPIDHVLVSDGWAVTSTRTLQIEGTDHKPVVAVVARR